MRYCDHGGCKEPATHRRQLESPTLYWLTEGFCEKHKAEATETKHNWIEIKPEGRG